MSANQNRPHVLVFPEDDANRQVATGFQLGIETTRQRQMQVLPVAGGWNEVLVRFRSDLVADMIRYPDRHIVLLIDFDSQQGRLEKARNEIPHELSERVFILGIWSEPEDLKQEFGSYESIGLILAQDCRDETEDNWTHPLLRHNANELARLRDRVRPILFFISE